MRPNVTATVLLLGVGGSCRSSRSVCTIVDVIDGERESQTTSVIVATRNRPVLLRELIESIARWCFRRRS
jgi:hypothetical protein